MLEATRTCGRRCGNDGADRRWDDASACRRAGREWPDSGFETLLGLTLRDVLDTHVAAARFGRTTGVGLVKEPFLQGIWEEYRENLEMRLDPVYVATRWVKHVVMHRPFRDANRRTAFLWASVHFGAFSVRVIVDSPDAILFKQSVRNAAFGELAGWFDGRVAESRMRTGVNSSR